MRRGLSKISWIALALLFGCTGSVETFSGRSGQFSGGTDFGNASDLISSADATHWLPGPHENPIGFCVEVSEQFGLSQAELVELVTQGFAKWENYLEKKRLPQSLLSIPTSYEPICSESTPLRFAFGVYRPELEGHLNPTRKPFGFAKPHLLRPGGTVWFASPGSYDGKFPSAKNSQWLFAEILHEIGHIYGNEHVPYTIMREDLASQLPLLAESSLEQIDHEHELVSSVDTLWACKKTAVEESVVTALSPGLRGPVNLEISRIAKDSPLQWLPFGSQSITFPQFESSTMLRLSSDESTVLFIDRGDEVSLAQETGHQAFRVKRNHLDLSWPVGTASYFTTLYEEKGSRALRLLMRRLSDDQLELRWADGGSLISRCPLNPTW